MIPHISAVLVEGITKQTRRSDMYAVGYILRKIVCSGILTINKVKVVRDAAAKCLSPRYVSRPIAQEVLTSLKQMLD